MNTLTSRVVDTLIEPSIVTVPAIRISRVTITMTSVVTASATTTMVTTVTDAPTSIPITTAIPPLPSAFDLPLVTGNDPTPAIVIVILVAVTTCALILLFALVYFIVLRIRGKCPTCPHYESELQKWKNGDLKAIKSEMVQERMQAWDLERGPMDVQAQLYRDRTRMQALANLEGRTLGERSSDGQADSLWSADSIDDAKNGQAVVKEIQATDETQDTIPAHVIATVAQLGEDTEATLVNPEFPKTHSAYLREIVAPREAEVKQALQKAEEQTINRYLAIASDPSNRESVQQRAMEKAKERIVEREEKVSKEGKKQLPAPRKDGESRFKEHFSLETNVDPR